MSFLVDPPMLVAAGAAIERLAPNESTARRAEIAVLATVLGFNTALYLNAPGLRWLWGSVGATSGRDFMMNSGVFRFEHRNPRARTNVAAVGMFAVCPLWVRLGRRLARRAAEGLEPARLVAAR